MEWLGFVIRLITEHEVMSHNLVRMTVCDIDSPRARQSYFMALYGWKCHSIRHHGEKLAFSVEAAIFTCDKATNHNVLNKC